MRLIARTLAEFEALVASLGRKAVVIYGVEDLSLPDPNIQAASVLHSDAGNVDGVFFTISISRSQFLAAFPDALLFRDVGGPPE